MEHRSGPEEVTTPSRRNVSDAAPRAFTWLVAALMTAWALSFIARFSSQVPYGDDWNHVEVLAGSRPVSLAWLVELDYGWRHVLPKLALVALTRVSSGDLSIPRYANGIILAVISFAMLATARRIRGRSSWTDAFFPIALLNWGHTRPFLQIHRLNVVLTLSLMLPVLAVMVSRPSFRGSTAFIAAGLMIAALPLCGAMGAAAAPLLALGLACAGYLRHRESAGAARREAAIAGMMTLLAVTATALYFLDFHGGADAPPSAGPAASAVVALRFMSMSLGPIAVPGWPLSGVAISLLLAAVLARLLGDWRRLPAERSRPAALMAFLFAMLAIAAAVGIGRSGYDPQRGDAGFTDQYATAAVPAIVAVYLAWVGRAESRISRSMQAILFLFMVVQLPYCTRIGLGAGNAIRERERLLLDDVRAGMEPKQLAARHWPYFYGSEGKMARRLAIMREAGFGPYRGLDRQPESRRESARRRD